MIRLFSIFFANAAILFTRLVTAFQVHWKGCGPENTQRIYYANHASHGDFVLIWTALPPTLRNNTRPVAGSDYWLKGRIRKFIALNVLQAVLVDRQHPLSGKDAIQAMSNAIDAGSNLILFPEGTRKTTETELLPFKSGIYRLAQKHPEVELVPVWLANLNRVLPKGEFVPVPLLCTVTFGTPLILNAKETKADFLARARAALTELAPKDLLKSEATQ